MSAVNSKQIARNTLFLYIRMLLILGVSLYTSRVILQVLGIEDYGIYNLIAGFVTFLAFISNALVSAMQRYFNVALGENNLQNYKNVFSMSINILIGFSLLIILIGETLGLWFVINFLNIPVERFCAALWVYQISLFTFVANTLRTPFQASIIAHEKMSFYAYVGIFEVLLRLGMVFLLKIIPVDYLIMYALLYLLVIIIVDAMYMIYCHKAFIECHYSFRKDKSLFKDLMSFSGWTLLGQASVVAKNQGEAIFINKFFSVAANAAMGVSMQVANALEMFVSNFQTAFNPQLIQSYASEDYDSHKNLLFRAAKFSYFLLLIMLVPIVANIDFILNLWLIEVPIYTNYFVTFILISYLFNALSSPFYTSLNASGHIKQYQIIHSIIFVAGTFFIYLVLRAGAKPFSVAVVAIFIQILLLFLRLHFSHKYVKFSYYQFIKEVMLRVILVSLLSMIVPCVFYGRNYNFWENILLFLSELIISVFIVFLIGLDKGEKIYIQNYIRKLCVHLEN